MTNIASPSVVLWQEDQQNKLFYQITVVLFLLAAILVFMVMTIKLPALTRAEKEKIPPQLVKIIKREAKVEPPKPKPIAKEEIAPEIIPKPELDLKETAKKAKELAEKTKKAKDKAKRAGLMAFADELTQMTDSVDVDSFTGDEVDSAFESQEGATASSNAAEADALSNLALRSNLAANDIGPAKQLIATTGLSGRKTKVYNQTSKANTYASASPEAAAKSKEKAKSVDSTDPSGERTTESIRQVFDKNKGALYGIYRRALRKDPTLEGKITIELVIEPEGNVSKVILVLSELDFEELEDKLLSRIKMINFGAQGTDPIQLNYTFNFLPF